MLPVPQCVGDIFALGLPSMISFNTLPIADLTPDVQSFMDRNEMWPVLDTAYNVKYELEKTLTVAMEIILERDAEARDREELVIVYSIANKKYKEILRIWDDVSRKVHESLPATISDKVYVRLVRA
jgi:hypothetical protein